MPSENLNAPNEIIYFRKGLAAVQIFYYVSLFTRVNDFFGSHGWMNRTYWGDSNNLLNLIESNSWRWILITIMISLLIMLYKGVLNRWGLVLFYIINLAFYEWNPFIIHEPQPILNLFFLSFFFLPMNKKHQYDPWIKNILIVFLGIYYFWAGIKKLPDLNFLNGSALEYIISWPIMAKNLNLNLFLVKHFVWIFRLFNYLTLIFEMSFLFLIFSRFRIYYIFFGILLHALIYATLEVGNFSFVMILWYALLLDDTTKFRISEKLAPLYRTRTQTV